jgi:trimethylamine---corrinoid protein Co-methyltransferase
VIEHPRVYQEQLDPDSVDAIYAAALRILEETGIIIQSQKVCELSAEAGALVDIDAGRVRFSEELVLQALETAPSSWKLHGRNPKKSVVLGDDRLYMSPGYGSPTVADADGEKRDATIADFREFARLAALSDLVDITGGLLVEPLDVSPRMRPLEVTRELISISDKPFFGSVAGSSGARDSLDLVRIVFPDMAENPVMIGLININSPLRLDGTMAGALLEYVEAGQPVLLTPGIMMGITAPVTATGALTQAIAELLGVVTAIQIVKPGAPVMIGLGGFGSDLRNGGPGFGRPENALATIMGAQMSRQLGLPFRCSGGVTGSLLPDCRSGFERMMTALAAWCLS